MDDSKHVREDTDCREASRHPRKRLVDARELADALALKVSTIRCWTRTTDLPLYRCGRATRFDVDEVLRWIRSGGPRRKA